MAFLASRSVGIRKTDGLLARAGELCGIIRASYLSPFFPLVLGFELWRYLRQQLQIGDRSVQTRYNRLSLRLLRAAAFGVTLMLPAKGWAQGDGMLASPQTPAKTSETSEEVEQTLDGAVTVTAEGVIGAEFVEFWPDISRHLFKKYHAAP